MKDFIKKGAKGAADMGSAAIKGALAGIMSEIAKEILEETGAADIAKEKLIEVGTSIVKDMGISPKEIQKDLIKTAIKKELNLD